MDDRPGENVVITSLPCPGRHGVYPGERDTVRTFRVDLSLEGTLHADDVERVAATARDAVAARSRALLESVADDVAAAVLASSARVTAVRVRVAKPDPPGLDAESEAVTLTRARPR